MICRIYRGSQFLGVTVLRRFSRSIEQSSSKKFNKDYQKRQDKSRGVPANFLKRMNEWPKLLQNEIDHQNEAVKSLLEASANDYWELERRGLAIGNLSVVTEFLDPIDGRLVALENTTVKNRNSQLTKGFRVGAPVVLCEMKSLKKVAECVFLKSNRKEITLKVRQNSGARFDRSRQYVVRPSTESGTLQSLAEHLNVEKLASSPGIQLFRYAFNEEVMPSIHNDRMPSGISDELNECQARAVAAALNKKRPFVCIQGPPGTGKTRVVAEIIKLLSERNQKVLVCAPSNIAVDNAMNKAVSVMKQAGVTFGKEKEDTDSAVGASRLDEEISDHPSYLDLFDLSQEISNAREANDHDAAGKSKKKFAQLKKQILLDVYKRRRVIFCTLSSSIVQRLAQVNWAPNVVVIDEAAQCIEPQAWAAIVKAPRCILVGDHAQLPAVIKSEEAHKAGLRVSLMERLCKEFRGANISHMLDVQYRMNQNIMGWSSDRLYESRLVAHDTVENIRLSDISDIPEEHVLNSPILMFDTASLDNCLEEEYRLSFRNFGEASLVSNYAKYLMNNGVPAESMGIIAPYYAQVEAIREMMNDKITVNTVDAFQGREKEVIIFSMVRSNPEKVVGFVRDVRRLNVAVTRAKRQFCLVGNGKMMEKHSDLRLLSRYIKQHGCLTSPSGVDFSFDSERAGKTRIRL